jgi:NADH:ubiquinone oxidoreductase subunit
MRPFLLLSLAVVTQAAFSQNAELPKIPQPEFSLQCYPETVMPGDTLYVMVIAKNPLDESIYINVVHYANEIQANFKDSENQTYTGSGKKLISPSDPPPPNVEYSLEFAEIKSKDSLIFYTAAINVPSLEDLKEPFWEKNMKKLEAGNEKFTLGITFKAYWDKNNSNNPVNIALETPIVLKSRPEKEMALIQKWYKSLDDFLKSNEFQNFGIFRDDRNNISVKKEKFRHWLFVRIVNFYPDISSIPATWQGWKDLEDSLTPSTMKDEIRLARIVIQFCDTEDAAVLKELKEWFDGMHDVQRTVLATSLLHKASAGYDKANRALLSPYRAIYKTISEYDKVPVSKHVVSHYRNLGLIE